MADIVRRGKSSPIFQCESNRWPFLPIVDIVNANKLVGNYYRHYQASERESEEKSIHCQNQETFFLPIFIICVWVCDQISQKICGNVHSFIIIKALSEFFLFKLLVIIIIIFVSIFANLKKSLKSTWRYLRNKFSFTSVLSIPSRSIQVSIPSCYFMRIHFQIFSFYFIFSVDLNGLSRNSQTSASYFTFIFN